MRHLLLQFILGCLAFSSQAIPVYLQPENRYPTGNYALPWLQKNTVGTVGQRWWQVQVDKGPQGWVPENQILTPLDLASHVQNRAAVYLRSEPKWESPVLDILEPSQKLRIVTREENWIQVEVSQNRFWLQRDSLLADRHFLGRAYLLQALQLQPEPEARGSKMPWIPAYSYLEILKIDKGSLQVRWNNSVGYIPQAHALTLSHLLDGQARLAKRPTSLRELPLPNAKVITELKFQNTLTLQKAKWQRWGLVQDRRAHFWWPLQENSEVLHPQEKSQLSTADLFKRNVFDMATLPAASKWQFASARGIFRSQDGRTWKALDFFGEENYPIAVSKNGSLFIGPYISEDSGQTFKTFIRWDQLIATLKHSLRLTTPHLKLIEIQALEGSDQKIQIILDVGLNALVKMTSPDQGRTWQTHEDKVPSTL